MWMYNSLDMGPRYTLATTSFIIFFNIDQSLLSVGIWWLNITKSLKILYISNSKFLTNCSYNVAGPTKVHISLASYIEIELFKYDYP